MHHALEIQEIILVVFRHCSVHKDLASLARTCRVFKEPALDVLWQELNDLSPLTRCLPDASFQPYTPYPLLRFFSRQLTAVEWDILQSYTRRIRSVKEFGGGIHERCIEILMSSPTTDPLFPNLRSLRCNYIGMETMQPLLHLPFPSLTSLFVVFDNPDSFQNYLKSVSECSHDISYLGLRMPSSHVALNQSVSNCICRWRNLQTVDFPQIALDMDALEHLSRMPTLTSLTLMSVATSTHRSSALPFSNLLHLKLRSASPGQTLRLLSQFQLSAITKFIARVDDCPSKEELAFFLACVRTSNVTHTLKYLEWYQLSASGRSTRNISLCATNLHPCTAFNNIRQIYLDLECTVDMGDDDLLALASAWPYLRTLEINPRWGWDTSGGITPNGFSQLLQTCPSLCSVALVIDTRDYTKCTPGATHGMTFPRRFYLNVLDSEIESESVRAVADFLSALEPCPDFILNFWRCDAKDGHRDDWREYRDRWDDVAKRVKGIAVCSRSFGYVPHFRRGRPAL